MYKLIQYFKRNYVFYIFLIAEGVALNYYANSSEYTRERMTGWATDLSGWISRQYRAVEDYFQLSETNDMLHRRVVELENRLSDTTNHFQYQASRIVSNSIARTHNYFVVDSGAEDGVTEDMAVLTTEGAVVGYVESVRNSYALCLSIVNRDFKVGGEVRGKEYFGQVVWEGGDARYARLIDVPHYADIVEGDTIQTIYSSRFPSGAFIGRVSKTEFSKDGTKLDITIRLGADMARLSRVVLVKNPDAQEIELTEGAKINNR